MTEHTKKSHRYCQIDLISDRFLKTQEDLRYRYQNEEGQLDWATINIRQSLLDWVSAGLIAKWVTRYRIWKDEFSNWKDFCRLGLGKDPYKIKKLIEHSEIMVELAEEGFAVLPVNQSQVEKLITCTKKIGCLVTEAWETVISHLPESLITADAIGQVLGFPSENTNIRISRELERKLRRQALEQGKTRSQLLSEIFEGYLEESERTSDDGEFNSPSVSSETDNNDETASTDNDDETEKIEPEAIQAWERDVENLIAEHDSQNWFWCVVVKLVNLVKPQSSQFSYLVT